MKKVYSLIFLIFAICYWQVPQIFFQQDEWLEFGLIIDKGPEIILRGLNSNEVFHFIPVDNLLNYLSFTFFGFNYMAFNVVGLGFHLINGLLVSQIALAYFKSKFKAFLAALIFLMSSASYQLIMWPLVSLNTLSLSFALGVWWLLSNYGARPKPNWWGSLIATLMMLSLLTVEYSIGLPLFILISYGIYQRRNKLSFKWPDWLPSVLGIGIYLSVRLLPYLYKSSNGGQATIGIQSLPFKMISYLPRYLGQLIIPDKYLVAMAEKVYLWYPFKQVLTISELLAIVIGIIAIILILLTLKGTRALNKLPEFILLASLFTITAILPFLLIPGPAGVFNLFPPRYMYYGLAGLAILWVGLFTITTRKFKLNRLILITALFYSLIGIFTNLSYQTNLIQISRTRQAILDKIKAYYPTIPNKTVFLINSDTAYYGLATPTLPFQSGFGQTLLIWYYPDKQFPRDYYGSRYLWDITTQGYLEREGYGFGYFRDYNLLESTVKQYHLLPDAVYSFTWHDRSKILINTTIETRYKLTTLEKDKI